MTDGPSIAWLEANGYVSRAAYDARITELLEANNREVERRRIAEAGYVQEANRIAAPISLRRVPRYSTEPDSKRAIAWLMGDGPDDTGRWFSDSRIAEGLRGDYWWRVVFQRMTGYKRDDNVSGR